MQLKTVAKTIILFLRRTKLLLQKNNDSLPLYNSIRVWTVPLRHISLLFSYIHLWNVPDTFHQDNTSPSIPCFAKLLLSLPPNVSVNVPGSPVFFACFQKIFYCPAFYWCLICHKMYLMCYLCSGSCFVCFLCKNFFRIFTYSKALLWS